ncbi:MAG: histidine kinase [Flavobacteriaceae bacterium]|nr:histidine kinase [Flavobacteriaceae bacterium]
MRNDNQPQERLERAKQYVEKIKGFYTHLFIYLLIVPLLIWLNVTSNTNFPWALFPVLGWGLGILGHASEVGAVNFFFGKEWEARKIKEYMDNQL